MRFKFSDKTKAVISAVAPTLGAALGGPLGGMAGNIIASAVGGGDDKKVEEALLVQHPETILALRKAEQDFQLKCKELELEPERLAVQDRASARDMAKVDMRPQLWISGLFLIGYFSITILRMTGVLVVSDDDKESMASLWGVLTTGVPIILAFWFGSTAGSARKSQMLYESKPSDGS